MPWHACCLNGHQGIQHKTKLFNSALYIKEYQHGFDITVVAAHITACNSISARVSIASLTSLLWLPVIIVACNNIKQLKVREHSLT